MVGVLSDTLPINVVISWKTVKYKLSGIKGVFNCSLAYWGSPIKSCSSALTYPSTDQMPFNSI